MTNQMGFLMAHDEITELLASCPNPETGCFANNPDALLAIMTPSAEGLQLSAIATAASKAGAARQPLKEAVYIPPFPHLEFNGITQIDIPSIGSIRAIGLKLGPTGPRVIGDLEKSNDPNDALRYQVALCANACGAAALGSCPLIKLITT